jgi:hypothetical protein
LEVEIILATARYLLPTSLSCCCPAALDTMHGAPAARPAAHADPLAARARLVASAAELPVRAREPAVRAHDEPRARLALDLVRARAQQAQHDPLHDTRPARDLVNRKRLVSHARALSVAPLPSRIGTAASPRQVQQR